MAKYINQTGYGLSQAIQNLNSPPIVAQRPPKSSDRGWPLGQIWIDKVAAIPYVLSSLANNSATWITLAASGGAVSATTLTSTGATTLATTGASVSTFGNTTGATSLSFYVGTGNYLVDGVGASTYAWGPSTTTGTFVLGGTAGTGTMTFGSSTGAQSYVIAGGASGAKTVDIATGATANVVTINSTTGAATTLIRSGSGGIDLDAATGSGFVVISAAAAASNGIEINNTVGGVLIESSLDNADAIYLHANGGTSEKIRIHADLGTGVDSIELISDAGGIEMNAATAVGISLASGGNVIMATGTVSAAAYAATLSTQVGQVTLTGQTLGAAASQVLTITNTLSTTTVPMFLTVTNGGTNDAQLTVSRIEQKAGSFEVTVTNNGAAALNGSIFVNFWLMS